MAALKAYKPSMHASKHKLLLGLLLLGLLGNGAAAQDIDLLKLQYNYLPDATLKESDDSARSSFHEWHASLVLPVSRNQKWTVLFGGLFNLVYPQSNLNAANSRLYFIALQCTTVYKLSDKHKIVGLFLPGISSTLEDPLSTKDFLAQFGFSYLISPNPSLTYGIGGVYNSSFGFPLVLPLLSLQYQKGHSLYDFTFPSHIKAIWNYLKPISYRLKASINGSQYNTPDQSQFNGNPIEVINFSRVLIDPELNFELRSQIHLSLCWWTSSAQTLSIKF